MKRLLVVTILLSLTVLAAAPAQVLTRPSPPSREVLDRLGLALAWKTRLKLPGSPDTMRSVQLLPSGADLQIAVQSQSGSVYLIDAQTGDLLWGVPVGNPYWDSQPVAFNARNLFVTRKDMLHVLDRANGRQRVYTVDKLGSRIDFGYRLPSAPSAPLVATEKLIYVGATDRAAGFNIPAFEAAELFAKEEYGGLFKVSSVQFEKAWAQKFAETLFTLEPLVSGDQISFVTLGGILSLNRFNGDPRFRFKGTDPLAAPPGQHEFMAYGGSTDAVLYAVNMRSGKLKWRYPSPAPILQRPAVTDKYVFVTSDRKGMTMLDRETGFEEWRNAEADSFLALGERFVYVTDRTGKLLVLDLRRGTALGQFDMFDWQIRVANDYTDRLFFAAHDGQLMCLYPKGSVTPLQNKSREGLEVKEPDKKDPPKDKDKDKDKEPDKDKEKDKDPDKDKGADKDKDKDVKDKDKDAKEKDGKDKGAWLAPWHARPHVAAELREDRRRAPRLLLPAATGLAPGRPGARI